MPYKYSKEETDKIFELKPSLRSHAKRRVRITEKLVEQLFQQYNIKNLKFGFSFNMGQSGDVGTMGYCSKDKITLSFYFVVWAKDMVRIKNELLHQICHALVGIENKHNQKWMKKAAEIGVNKIDKYRISNSRIKKQKSFHCKLNNLSDKERKKLKWMEKRATELMQKHQVDNYKFVINNNSKCVGLCNAHTHTIAISLHHALNDDECEIENTILHEIAHALVGVHHGHKKIWQDKAKQLGVTWTKKYHA